MAQQLRTKYSEVEGSMRTAAAPKPEQRIVAERVFDYLKNARELLEKCGDGKHQKSSTIIARVIEASANLNNADRYIIWLYPKQCLVPEAHKILSRLDRLRPLGWERLCQDILACDRVPSDNETLKTILDHAVAAINETIIDNHISTKLQIKCLDHLRWWGLGLGGCLLLFSPLALNPEPLKSWPINALNPEWPHFASFLRAVVIVLCGSLGGFLSALMDARRIKMTIESYQERFRLLILKPIVGALAAIILFFLLSWSVVPGISITTPGMYLMVAFLAGFSEKYFLRLLPLQGQNARDQSFRTAADATAGSGKISETGEDSTMRN